MSEEAQRRPIESWAEWLEQSIALGAGAVALTAETAQRLVNDLVARGQVAKEEAGGLIERLLQAGKQQRAQMQAAVAQAAEQAVQRLHLARRDEVDELRRRIEVLEHRMPDAAQPGLPEIPPPTPEEEMRIDQE